MTLCLLPHWFGKIKQMDCSLMKLLENSFKKWPGSKKIHSLINVDLKPYNELILLSFQSSLCWLILALHAPTSFPTFLLSVFFAQFSFPLYPWSVGTWWVRSCSLLLLLYSFSLGACFHFMALPLTTSSPWCHWLPPDSRSKCSFDCVSPECPNTPLVPTSPYKAKTSFWTHNSQKSIFYTFYSWCIGNKWS